MNDLGHIWPDEPLGGNDRDQAALERVRKFHRIGKDNGDCPDADSTFGCQHRGDEHVITFCQHDDEPWPCDTIRAIGDGA